MLRYGRITVIVGLLLTIVSLIVGFIAMFTQADGFAKVFLALVPVGFVILFAGLVTTLLAGTDNLGRPPE